MKTFVAFCCLWVVSSAVDNEVCYNKFVSFCGQPSLEVDQHVLNNCNASYGGAEFLMTDLSSYANDHISTSFYYLLLASNFGSFEKNRKGFEKLFRHLSDNIWEDGIDLIKYINKRGGRMSFNNMDYVQPVASLNEIQGLGRALDTQKKLAETAHGIHLKANEKDNHEPELSSYLENKFLHKHADIIRNLAGYITDVKQMITYPTQKSVSMFVFDEYLKNHLY